VTVITATASAQTDPTNSTQIQVSFGPTEVWQPSDDALQALFACQPQATFSCVSQVMKSSGASPDAIAFYGLTGWFLTDITDSTPVHMGTILMPWRANENSQTALLGGVPAVVYLEQATPTYEAESSPSFQELKLAHSNAMFWPESPTLDHIEMSPQGGQRFVFRYRVLDGCHACAVLGYVPIAFDFTADGTYMSAHVLAST
jgi:hypothetical protein